MLTSSEEKKEKSENSDNSITSSLSDTQNVQIYTHNKSDSTEDDTTSCSDYNDIEKATAQDNQYKLQRRLLTPFLIDKKVPPIPENDSQRIKFPYGSTSFLNELFFIWCIPLLNVGYRRIVDPQDLYVIDEDCRLNVEKRSNTFMYHFNKKKQSYESKYMKKHNIEDTPQNRENLKHDPNFKYSDWIALYAVYHTLTREIWDVLICKTAGDIAADLNPLLIRAFINYVHKVATGEKVGKNGYGMAVGLASVVCFQGLMFARFFHSSSFVGAETKGILNKVLIDKALKLDRSARLEYTPSVVTTLLGNDLSKIDLACAYVTFIIGMPLGIIITIALLCVNLGGASLGGVAYFVVVSSMVAYTTKFLVRYRKKTNVFTDARVKYVKELLGSMKIIKYYSWETPYTELISKIRKSEMGVLLKIQFLRNSISAIAVSLASVSAMVGFLSVYGYYGYLKNAANIFASVTLFNILTSHVAMLPTALSTGADAAIALKRVQKFLLATEEIPDPEYHFHSVEEDRPAIQITNGEFKWEDSNTLLLSNDGDNADAASVHSKTPSPSNSSSQIHTFSGLHDINLTVAHNEFIVITGSIGAGKSSLLSAMSSLMPRVSGSIDISGKLLLCSVPWIQNTTVRSNITFGLPYNRDLYHTIVDACALESDFNILPAGDQTEIGERGVNLSGGQKARINLARSVYKVCWSDENNVILLDDVLSAVDAKVGKHIMTECLMGLLKGKTRVLATHQLALIGTADRIIFLNGDGTIDVGTQSELTTKNELFKNLMAFQQESSTDKKTDEEGIEDETEEEEEVNKLIRRQTTKIEYSSNKGKLVQAEHREVNGIKKEVLKEYISSGCGKAGLAIMVPAVISSIVLTTFCMLFQNVWLSFWSLNKFPGKSTGFYIGIYVMFSLLFVLCATWEFCTLVFMCNNASKTLNIKALKKIMHAPMSFFDTTPMGRILNRFTKDTDALDNEIAEQLRLFCFGIGNMFGVLILCVIYMPYFAIAVPFLFLYATSSFSYYQATAREVKRIEGVQRSIVYSTFDEILQGTDTIKMYNNTELFMNKNKDQINTMNEAYYLTNSLQRFFAVTLHFASGFVNLVVAMLCASKVFPISGASSGLLVSYLVSFSMQLISTSKAAGQLEQLLNSVERVCEYAIDLPQEKPYHSRDDPTNLIEPSPEWPTHGKIKFSNVYLKYRPSLPYVLKNLNVEFNPSEKIGICGRTGAGKSTIMTALYRLSEPENGEVLIDGINIQKIGLFELRSKLTIIPQDPILFRGTVRQNLDPFGELSDDVLYKALLTSGCISVDEFDKVKIQTTQSEDLHKFHLDNIVEDNGDNFSLGQRQIMALCRALVKDSKILILDEATSSVDYETDSKIQQTIVNEFNHCTILCIAHRLKTIINYDRILVMDKGEVAEFDTPLNLYNMRDGIFRSMCDKSGISESDF